LIFNIAKGIEDEQTDISKTRQTRNNAPIKGKKESYYVIVKV